MTKNFLLLYIFILIVVLAPKKSISQDVEFSQFFSVPLHLNPALAGISFGPRFVAAYRNQWPGLGNGINGGFVSYVASYDQHFEKIHGGIGISLLADQISSGTINRINPTVSYSFQARITQTFGMKIAIEGSFHHISLDWNELLKADVSNSLAQFGGLINLPTVSAFTPPVNSTVNKFDLNTGLVLFSDKLFMGATVKHLLRPDLSFYGNEEDRLDLRLGLHAGAVAYFGDRRKSETYLSPNAMFLLQGPFKQITAGMLLNVKSIFGGVYFRHNIKNSDAVIFQVGVSESLFRLGYSFDAQVSDLNKTTSRGTHELILTFNLARNDNSLNPRSRSGILTCPPVIGF
ncbi:MAG: PorP/SprF family type IX secretion system membrane protein [Chitinophagales bacterium]|nr:PorP/SprF family type IX secretion system membrane protein [Chitinophagales bacterium]